METYKFETTVQEDGVIKIPEIAKLAHQRVEISVVISSSDELASEPSQYIEAFINKWRGFLKGFDPDELKSKYLQEKYG